MSTVRPVSGIGWLALYVVALISLVLTAVMFGVVALGLRRSAPRTRLFCTLMLPGVLINLTLLVLRITDWGV